MFRTIADVVSATAASGSQGVLACGTSVVLSRTCTGVVSLGHGANSEMKEGLVSLREVAVRGSRGLICDVPVDVQDAAVKDGKRRISGITREVRKVYLAGLPA